MCHVPGWASDHDVLAAAFYEGIRIELVADDGFALPCLAGIV